MSVELTDLQTTYYVRMSNKLMRRTFDVYIQQSLKYQIWYIKTNADSLFRYPNEDLPFESFGREDWRNFFETNRLEGLKYKTAERALSELKFWAHKFNYELSPNYR